MRLLFVADGRSPIAVNWIRYFSDKGHEVHLATTFAASPPLQLASVEYVPVALSGLRDKAGTRAISRSFGGADQISFRTRMRQLLGPYTLPFSAKKLSEIELRLEPDITHAMRIPFEGMLASHAKVSTPLIISIWGNDFTLHGNASSKMRDLTTITLRRTDGLHVDCKRDLRLAMEWGYPSTRPAAVLPGSGGIDPEIFYPSGEEEENERIVIRGRELEIKADSPVIVNPRGFRAYVRNDTFFESIPMILEQVPDAAFLCPAMEGVGAAEGWLAELGVAPSVFLLPKLTAKQMAQVYRRSIISVSPSEHDGTPNSLLESMACGCFPIAGKIESIEEWIEDGINGLLVDPSEPADLARAVIRVLRSQRLIKEAKEENFKAVKQRAIRSNVMEAAEGFYRSVLSADRVA